MNRLGVLRELAPRTWTFDKRPQNAVDRGDLAVFDASAGRPQG
jgi:hypothetical protein